ncbi:hypothetical protein C3L33_09931, partial [Rhododendron williamsianum]
MVGSWFSFTWFSRDSLPLALLLLLLLPLLLIWTGARKKATRKRPPGPAGWPVVGNMFDLGTIPHITQSKLRFKYGPVLWLKLGSVNTMVIQSPKAAAELFKNHDSTFCDRRVPHALTSWNYNQGSIAIGNYGTYWRLLRKLCNLMLSRDLLEPHSEGGREFFDAMNKIGELAKASIADFLPFLKWMDPMGIKSNMDRHMGKAMKIVAEFVTEKVRQKKDSGTEKANKDFLNVMLEYEGDGKEGPDKISESNVTIIYHSAIDTRCNAMYDHTDAM